MFCIKSEIDYTAVSTTPLLRLIWPQARVTTVAR